MAIIEEIFDEPSATEADTVLQQAESIKNAGNAFFGRGEWDLAKREYQKGLDQLRLAYPLDTKDTEEKTSEIPIPAEASALRSILLSNMTAALIKLEQWKEAVETATSAIKEGPTNEKALERRAFAYAKMDDKLSSALDDYKALHEKFPNRPQYKQKIVELQRLIDEQNEKLKQEMIEKLKGFGDFCLRPFGLSTNSFELTPNDGGGYSIGLKKANEPTGRTSFGASE